MVAAWAAPGVSELFVAASAAESVIFLIPKTRLIELASQLN